MNYIHLPIDGSGGAVPALASMAQPLRIEFPGAVYPILARGNQGGPIFVDDRQLWLATLEEACQKTGWQLQNLLTGLDAYGAKRKR